MKKFYITTPLYYVNDVPHIGHAYTTIAADVVARWRRLNGQPVFFLTGTDEHGSKISDAAAKAGETPQAFVNRVAGEFKKLWVTLNISNDDFIQTTQERHKKVVQAVFEKLKASDDIYKGTYEGWYCVPDETYFSESEIVAGNCPVCGRPLQKLREESYFFRLSKYEQPLLAHYAAHPEFLSPTLRANEIMNFVKSGLKDLSATRTRVSWGIQVPSDPSHVVYVWVDALLNYITAAGYGASAPGMRFDEVWPADIHLVGKEIFRFHTVIWPAMLMALGLPLPRRVFAHGWWTVDGAKMSKSVGNVVDPAKMCAEYGVDAFRYFLLREVPFGADGDFSEKSLLGRYNSELANNLGNLLQRTCTLLVKNFDGSLPPASQSRMLGDASRLLARIEKAYDGLAFGEVLEEIIGLMVKTNQYIDEMAPWKLGPDDKDKLAVILGECAGVLRALAVLLWPFMPTKTEEMWRRLGEAGSVEKDGSLWLNSLKAGRIPDVASEQKVQKGDPLFMRKSGKSQ